ILMKKIMRYRNFSVLVLGIMAVDNVTITDMRDQIISHECVIEGKEGAFNPKRICRNTTWPGQYTNGYGSVDIKFLARRASQDDKLDVGLKVSWSNFIETGYPEQIVQRHLNQHP
ncbi:hypothetical protein CLF_113265, partial [Clonorchis sinensis]